MLTIDFCLRFLFFFLFVCFFFFLFFRYQEQARKDVAVITQRVQKILLDFGKVGNFDFSRSLSQDVSHCQHT